MTPEIVSTDEENGATPVMQPPATAARSVGTLARRFVELLLEADGRFPRDPAPRKDADFDEFDFDDDGEAVLQQSPEIATLSVDEAAAAVLMAVQLEEEPSLLKSMRREAPIVVVQIPDEHLETAVMQVLRVCVLGQSTRILSALHLDALRTSTDPLEKRSAVILSCETDKRGMASLASRAGTAMSLDIPACFVTLDPIRSVPEMVRRMADSTLVLKGWTDLAMAVFLEAVTGQPVSVTGDEWLSSVTLDDLRMSVSQQRGSARSLEQLRLVVRRRTGTARETPLLQDLSGYGEARRVGLEMIDDLKAYQDGRIGWEDVGRGLVLSGPPGTGKTYFAHVFARTAGLPLVIGSLAAWQSSGDGHLGHLLTAMRRTFAEARAAAPSILLIDELDSFGDRKSFDHRNRDYSSQVVNALLQELDGAIDRIGVVVLGATNLPGRIDTAILRSGRLDRMVEIGLPDTADLAGILRTQLGTELPDADLRPVAVAGRGGSGADVAGWIRRARGVARRRREAMTLDDVLQAVRDGRDALPEEDRVRVSIHEAAHACSAIVLGIGTVTEIYIHESGGATRVEPARRSSTRSEAVAFMVHYMAGRVAERLVTGSASAGAGGRPDSDLAMATRLAFNIETSWGLGELGPVWLCETGSDVSDTPAMTLVLPAVRRLLRHAETEADRLVVTYRAQIARCARHLRESESGHLDGDAIIAALGDLPSFRIEEGAFDQELPGRRAPYDPWDRTGVPKEGETKRT